MRKILYPLALCLGLAVSPAFSQQVKETQVSQSPAIKLERKLMIPDEAFSQEIQKLDLSRAKELYRLGRYNEAIRDLESQLEKIKKYEFNLADPKDRPILAETLCELGYDYLKMGMLTTAKEHFLAALDLDPGCRSALLDLASAHLKQPQKDYAEIRAIASHYLQIGGENRRLADQYIEYAERALKAGQKPTGNTTQKPTEKSIEDFTYIILGE